MIDHSELLADIRKLLASFGLSQAGIVIDGNGGFGTWRSKAATGTWGDDGEVFMDD